MLFGTIFQRYMNRAPFAVMSRAILERALCPKDLDALFERQADKQYTRELLFSSTVDLLSLVVTSTYGSVRAAYVDDVVEIPVSLTSVYNKLSGIEDSVSAELVRHTAGQLIPVITQLGGVLPEPIPGYRMRVLDGNDIAATEHRLKETRNDSAAPLPGQSLAIYEPAYQMVTDIVLCEDGHAQERSLLGPVIEMVKERDLWLADRNFCVKAFLLAMARRLGFFIIREHKGLNSKKIGKLRRVGRIETGEVFEQVILIEDEDGKQWRMRRVEIRLDEPTRDGEWVLALISNLPVEVNGKTVAETYRKRWTIEAGFLDLTTTLCCEINTLCYPKAALFAFCVAVAAYNVQSAIKRVLGGVHPEEKIEDNFSRYFMAGEIAGVHRGMMIALPAEEWDVFRTMTAKEFAEFLRDVAGRVEFHRYPKSTRGAKKPQPKRRHNKNRPHVATSRILLARKAKQQCDT
jgi:hypothetical protein